MEGGFDLAATSALGHVTVALASAAPELDSTPINKLTDDMQSVVFDVAVRCVLLSFCETNYLLLYVQHLLLEPIKEMCGLWGVSTCWLDADYEAFNPSTPTVAIWVQIKSILCPTGLSCHL